MLRGTPRPEGQREAGGSQVLLGPGGRGGGGVSLALAATPGPVSTHLTGAPGWQVCGVQEQAGPGCGIHEGGRGGPLRVTLALCSGEAREHVAPTWWCAPA